MSKTNIENGTAESSALWVHLTKEECFEICAKYKNRPFSLLVAVQDALRAKNIPSEV